MVRLKSRLICLALNTLYYSGLQHLFSPTWSGVGVIFTLHHVRPKKVCSKFNPNTILEVTPEFLDSTIQNTLAAGYDAVSLDEAQRRLVEHDFKRKFMCFTLDDGYMDNYQYAFPIFKKYDIPFTVYVNTGIPDGTAILWWWLLEFIIRDHNQLKINLNDKIIQFDCKTVSGKYRTFNKIYWSLRKMPHDLQYITIKKILIDYNVDPFDFCRNEAMTWEMIKEISDSEIGTIGAHTIKHIALSKLSEIEVREEAESSRDLITKHIGKITRHFSYPFGDAASATIREFKIIKDLDFATATTTRKGLLYPEHEQHLHALPRVSLNGCYQKQRYINLFLSGAPFALWQKFNRINVY